MSSAQNAVRYIVSRQASDGSFASASRADMTAETLASLASVGAPRSSVDKALAALRRNGPGDANRPAFAGRIVLGLVAVAANPRSFGGVDYVSRISSGFNAQTGAYETGLYSDALALLGLVAAHETIPAQAIAYLRVNQCANGGFGHDPGCAQADVDTTAVVLSAAVGAGVPSSDALRANAISWLRSVRFNDGTFPESAGDAPNANSTGLAICALATARSPVDAAAIAKFQDRSGGFRYLETDSGANDYATEQALPAVIGATYPLHGHVVDPTIADPAQSISSASNASGASDTASGSGAPGGPGGSGASGGSGVSGGSVSSRVTGAALDAAANPSASGPASPSATRARTRNRLAPIIGLAAFGLVYAGARWGSKRLRARVNKQ